MKILVIGLGSIGKRHAQILSDLGHDVIGYDTKSQAQVVSEWKQPLPRRFVVCDSLWDAMKQEPGAVVVASPPAQHYAHAKISLEAGLPTFVEKPLTLLLTEARALCELAVKRNIVLAVGYQMRVALDEVAWPEHIYAAHAEFGYNLANWRKIGATYSLPILWESSHELDALRHVVGPIGWVMARGQYERVSLICTHTDGALSTVHLDSLAPTYQRWLSVYAKDQVKRWQYKPEDAPMHYRQELEAWLAGRPYCTGEQAFATVLVCAAAERSLVYGRDEQVGQGETE